MAVQRGIYIPEDRTPDLEQRVKDLETLVKKLTQLCENQQNIIEEIIKKLPK